MINETIEALRLYAARATYPITTFEQLALALGGADARITIKGTSIPVSDAAALVPAYYFPIDSEADFVAKVADLGVRAGLTEREWHEDWRVRSELGLTEFRPDCWS